MRRAIVFAVLVATLTGCSRRPPVNVRTSAGASAASTGVFPSAERTEWGPAKQPRTAEQWAAQLSNSHPAAAFQASLALRDLKDEGYPHLARAVLSDSLEVRRLALAALSAPVLLARHRERLPLLIGLLRNSDPFMRQHAASRLGCFGTKATTVRPALDQMAANDVDPNVRGAAAEAVYLIDLATGKIAPLPEEDGQPR